MAEQQLDVRGIAVPRFFYGTAWKEGQTESLTRLALQQGFRGIDTANQRRHYYEEGVGKAIAAAIRSGLVRREDLFLQTKFTFASSQDHRLPYDPQAPTTTQVHQSFASSQQHLGTSVIDSYVLHGPSRRTGLADSDWAAWQAMEAIHERGDARLLGVSNVSLEQLQQLCREARVAPHFVQNRCYASTGWDREVRRFCAEHQIVYQGFSLLTANRNVLTDPTVERIAQQHGRAVSQIVFRFAMDVGMIPLTGTTSADHMRIDLEVLDFQLPLEDVAAIERVAVR